METTLNQPFAFLKLYPFFFLKISEVDGWMDGQMNGKP